jgi:hypothetical protein
VARDHRPTPGTSAPTTRWAAPARQVRSTPPLDDYALLAELPAHLEFRRRKNAESTRTVTLASAWLFHQRACRALDGPRSVRPGFKRPFSSDHHEGVAAGDSVVDVNAKRPVCHSPQSRLAVRYQWTCRGHLAGSRTSLPPLGLANPRSGSRSRLRARKPCVPRLLASVLPLEALGTVLRTRTAHSS